jgi:hypothetical protein
MLAIIEGRHLALVLTAIATGFSLRELAALGPRHLDKTRRLTGDTNVEVSRRRPPAVIDDQDTHQGDRRVDHPIHAGFQGTDPGFSWTGPRGSLAGDTRDQRPGVTSGPGARPRQ